MKQATFTTGETETYTGKREVSACWAVIANGSVYDYGFSKDEAAAHKTGNQNLKRMQANAAYLTKNQGRTEYTGWRLEVVKV